jgi:hypothetical protein
MRFLKLANRFAAIAIIALASLSATPSWSWETQTITMHSSKDSDGNSGKMEIHSENGKYVVHVWIGSFGNFGGSEMNLKFDEPPTPQMIADKIRENPDHNGNPGSNSQLIAGVLANSGGKVNRIVNAARAYAGAPSIEQVAQAAAAKQAQAAAARQVQVAAATQAQAEDTQRKKAQDSLDQRRAAANQAGQDLVVAQKAVDDAKATYMKDCEPYFHTGVAAVPTALPDRLTKTEVGDDPRRMSRCQDEYTAIRTAMANAGDALVKGETAVNNDVYDPSKLQCENNPLQKDPTTMNVIDTLGFSAPDKTLACPGAAYGCVVTNLYCFYRDHGRIVQFKVKNGVCLIPGKPASPKICFENSGDKARLWASVSQCVGGSLDRPGISVAEAVGSREDQMFKEEDALKAKGAK